MIRELIAYFDKLIWRWLVYLEISMGLLGIKGFFGMMGNEYTLR